MWFSTGSDEIELLVPPQPLTRLPGRDRSSGLFKHAGLLIDVLDLRRCLSFESKAASPTERFIVVKTGDAAFGFHVDEVANIVDKASGRWGDVPIYVPPRIFSATFEYKGRLYLHTTLLALRNLEPGVWRELGASLLAAGEALQPGAISDKPHDAGRAPPSMPCEEAPSGMDKPRTDNRVAGSRPSKSKEDSGVAASRPSEPKANSGVAASRPAQSKVNGGAVASRASKPKVGSGAVAPARSSASKPGRPSLQGKTLHASPRPAGEGQSRGGSPEPGSGSGRAESPSMPGRPGVRTPVSPPVSQATAQPTPEPAMKMEQAIRRAPSGRPGEKPGPTGPPTGRETASAVETAPDQGQRAWGGWALLILLLCVPALMYGFWKYGDTDPPRRAVETGSGAGPAPRDETYWAGQEEAVEGALEATRAMASLEPVGESIPGQAESTAGISPQPKVVEFASDAGLPAPDETSRAEGDEVIDGDSESMGTDLLVEPSSSGMEAQATAEAPDIPAADSPAGDVETAQSDQGSGIDTREASAHISRQGRVVTIEIEATAPQAVLTQEGASVAVEGERPTLDATADDALEEARVPHGEVPPKTDAMTDTVSEEGTAPLQTSGDPIGIEPDDAAAVRDVEAISAVDVADAPGETEPPAVSAGSEGDAVPMPEVSGSVEADSDWVSGPEPQDVVSAGADTDAVTTPEASALLEAVADLAGGPEPEEANSGADEHAGDTVVSVYRTWDDTAADASPTSTSEPQGRLIVHIVVKGDTLWDIAKRYIDDPFRYPELARLSRIKNPHLIYPGDKVRILLRAPRTGERRE